MDLPLMQDKTVSLTSVFAWVLWVVAIALVLVDVFTEVNSGDLGIVAAAGGATLTVRGYFLDLEDRERNAFEIGRDSTRRVR